MLTSLLSLSFLINNAIGGFVPLDFRPFVLYITSILTRIRSYYTTSCPVSVYGFSKQNSRCICNPFMN